MELGSIAEWVIGISKLLAISVALFLPYFSEKKKKKAMSRKVVVIARNMAFRVLNEKGDYSGKKIEKLDSYREFRQYVDVVSVILNNPFVSNKITEYNELLLSVSKDNSNIGSIQETLEIGPI